MADKGFFYITFKDKTRFEKTLEKLKNTAKDWMDLNTAGKLGSTAVAGMKDLISSGISPIRGGSFGGKFPQYKNRKKYPGDRKPATPVNLNLTGAFLDSLDYEVVQDKNGTYKVIIGFGSNSKSNDKERGHRDGANGQPKRPIIPQTKKREYLAVKIENQLSKILKARLKQILSEQ